MELSINGEIIEILNFQDFTEYFNTVENEKYLEIDLFEENNMGIFVLLNEEYALVLFFRYEGDSGLSAINNKYANSDKLESFKLSNGQMDEYPLNYLIDRKEIFSIIECFINEKKMSDSVEWHEEDLEED